MSRKIEAVTVCSGYADFLAATAAHNRPHLDRWVVVTTSEDRATQRVCTRHSIEVLVCDEDKRDGEFSKGRLIDRGLAMLGGRDWLLHLDADIVLPTDFGPVLDDAHLDPKCLYGCDRLNVVGHESWTRILADGLQSRQVPWATHVDRPDTAVGARVTNLRFGYTPIGFFQLWHGSHPVGLSYPHHHGTAARTDVQHALRWDRRNRVFLPELLVWHLESAPARMGANWRGRTTPNFGSENDTYEG